MDRTEIVSHLYKGGAHSPETRASNLIRYFGWQGGTIHQIATETGVDVQTLLYGQPNATDLNSKFSHGACASETCALAFRLKLANQTYGLADYWIGVGESRPLD